MEPTLPLLALTTVLDRAGVPLATVAGVLLCRADGRSPVLFVTGCIAAGWIGDLLCFALGRALAAGGTPARPRLLRGRTLRARVLRMARFVDAAPRRWLLFGRAFALVNQFVPMAAGARGRRAAETLWTTAVGNTVWIGGFALLASWYGEVVRELEPAVRWAGAVLGVAAVGVGLRLAGRASRAAAAGSDPR